VMVERRQTVGKSACPVYFQTTSAGT
jgi:hypothetical protein